ncbi:conserved hypothetical protein [Ricinus communis]|uniref:Uncharacterized protein n=1 Tax=Ricinus communis TaxID=3988 RepID=B9T3K7_RICCO|nr:conserved hypothetical protein [Ricinus communis]
MSSINSLGSIKTGDLGGRVYDDYGLEVSDSGVDDNRNDNREVTGGEVHISIGSVVGVGCWVIKVLDVSGENASAHFENTMPVETVWRGQFSFGQLQLSDSRCRSGSPLRFSRTCDTFSTLIASFFI